MQVCCLHCPNSAPDFDVQAAGTSVDHSERLGKTGRSALEFDRHFEESVQLARTDTKDDRQCESRIV